VERGGSVTEYETLTVLQPWASALIYGPKRVENRMWQPNSPLLQKARTLIGQRIAIHAGKQWYSGMEPAHKSSIHPLGAVLGTMRLDAVIPKDIRRDGLVLNHLKWTLSHSWAEADSNVWLVLADPQPFDKPIPTRGQQGWWKWKGGAK